MRLNLLIAAAVAELRTASRLTRTRLFIVLAVLTTFGCYFAVSGFHAMGSVELPRAFPPPRFLISGFGSPMLWLLLAGTVFMAFDIGVRDRRERIADVLDSRPVANVYLLGGRLCAVVLTAWVPVVFAAVAIQLYGVAARSFEWPFGDVVEPASLIVFLTVDALPALAIWAAIVMLLAAVLRNRLAVATVAIGLLGLHFWWLSTMPPWLLALLAFAPDRLVSDLTTSIPDARTFLQRGSVLLCAVGFLALAAACVARRDSGSRARCAVAGAVLAAVGFAGIGVAVLRASEDLEQRAEWLAAHQQARDPIPEIEQLRGDVVIDPGSGLDIDVELRLAWRGEAHHPGGVQFQPRHGRRRTGYRRSACVVRASGRIADRRTTNRVGVFHGVARRGRPGFALCLPRRHDRRHGRRCAQTPACTRLGSGHLRGRIRCLDARRVLAAGAWSGAGAGRWPGLLYGRSDGSGTHRLAGGGAGPAATRRRIERPLCVCRPGTGSWPDRFAFRATRRGDGRHRV